MVEIDEAELAQLDRDHLDAADMARDLVVAEQEVAGLFAKNERLRDALRGLLAVFTFADEQCLVEIEVAEEYPNQPASARHHMGPLYPDDQARVEAARAALGETDDQEKDVRAST